MRRLNKGFKPKKVRKRRGTKRRKLTKAGRGGYRQ